MWSSLWSSLWSSEVIRGHHCGHQRSSVVISLHQRTRARRGAAGRPRSSRIPTTDRSDSQRQSGMPSVVISGHQWSSVVISDSQRQSGMPSVVISGSPMAARAPWRALALMREVISDHHRSSVVISGRPPEGAPWRALARTAGRPSPHRTPFDHPRHRRHHPRRWRPRRRPSADVWRVARRKPSLRRRPSRVPHGCCFWSPVIGGHQRSLEVIRGHQRQ